MAKFPRAGPEIMDPTAERCVSSLLTLVNTAKGMEQDAKDDHSYAFNEEKTCFEGREKDHNYSTNSKTWFMGHRKTQSLSDVNIFKSTENELDSQQNQTAPVYLPHYQSNDSALDVTGFDTISRKCISYENIDMKTVDVFTDRCILPGTSDPDISRMTLGSGFELNSSVSVSVPNSPHLSDLRASIEHNYSRGTIFERLWNYKQTNEQQKIGEDMIDKSPLFDHSYDLNKNKHHSAISGIKNGGSTEKVNKFCQAFTKSPFLDHTYQSVWSQATNIDINVPWKRGHLVYSSDKVFPKPPFLDHSYNTVIDDQIEISTPVTSFVRNRSSSVSACVPFQIDPGSDHSYVINNKEDTLSMSCGSDSGTESFTAETDEDVPTSFRSLVSLQKDHPYFTDVNSI